METSSSVVQPQFDQPAALHTRMGAFALSLRVASRWQQRMRGLLGAPELNRGWLSESPTQGLLLMPCNNVHGWGMKHTLDIVYLAPRQDAKACCWTVQHVCSLKPWGISAHWRSHHTLELPSGAIQSMGLQPGDRLEM